MEMSLFNIFDLLGTVAFAISGALAAMNRRMDLFGIFIIGFVTATGGGTLRDVLIGQTPVNWMHNLFYVYLIGLSVIIAIIFRNKLEYLKKSLFLFDTIGLGVFTITGVETGIQNGLAPLISIALGGMTGAFGGVIRDILCNEIPVIFRKAELYATACIIGGLFFVIMYRYEVNIDIIYVVTSLTVILIRLLAVKYHITLPNFYPKSTKTEQDIQPPSN
ncbi:trimeric intracellular cation channel family protein [Gramella sp. BOM4]|nr:trimeric intracellular cation channel family protein [Christiangramia bathymodioli]